MEWINTKDKHFVDITYDTPNIWHWEENNNCPKEPFLVAIHVFNNKTKESNWEKYLVILNEYHGIADIDGNYIGWDLVDIEFWCKITNPDSSHK